MSDCDLCDCEVRGTIGTYVLRSIAFSGQYRDNNGPARRRPTHSTSAVASPPNIAAPPPAVDVSMRCRHLPTGSEAWRTRPVG